MQVQDEIIAGGMTEEAATMERRLFLLIGFALAVTPVHALAQSELF